MAYTYGKKTWGQKTKGLLKKGTLLVTFASIAGGYNFYWTKEDITAKVISVEGTNVQTDKGWFVNEPTRMFMKDEKETAAIAKMLKPGTTVKFGVYGANPKIGSLTRDDFRFYRNISGANEVSSAGASPTKDIVPVSGVEDTMAPGACEANSNLAGIEKNIPQLARDLAIMEKLPLTGKPVYDMLKDSADLRSCLIATPLGVPAASSYSHQTSNSKPTLSIARNSGTSATAHESYHAAQDISAGSATMFTLTSKDALIANLMTEATSVAYELAAQKEAENHGLNFVKMDASVESAADKQKNIAQFHKAYDESWSRDKNEAKALEAGGKSVVRLLLAGGDDVWQRAYTSNAMKNVNNNLDAFTPDRELDPSYKSKRNDVFVKAGALLPKISFVPDEYLGADADVFINECYTRMGFKSMSVPKRANFPSVG